jgi:hypothetical protein
MEYTEEQLNKIHGNELGKISELSYEDLYNIIMYNTDRSKEYYIKAVEDIINYKSKIEKNNPYEYIIKIEIAMQTLRLRYKNGLIDQLEGIKKYDINYDTDYELILEQLKLWYPLICNSIIDNCKKLKNCLGEDNEKKIPIA